MKREGVAVETFPSAVDVDAPIPGADARQLFGGGESAIQLKLTVRDPEVVAALSKLPPGNERDEFALSALRVGVLAIRQASGSIDTTAIQTAATGMLAAVAKLLDGNASELYGSMSRSLKEYFDPNTGKLSERLERLVKKDGELANLLGANLDGESSKLARTLSQHIGEQSPLMRMLSPDQKSGLLATLGDCVQKALHEQREHILKQFSLDDKASALARLVSEISSANGELRKELSGDMDKVKKEFSLDSEDSALARLVSRVERAQKAISQEFSTDNENSALNRLTGLLQQTHEKVDKSLTLDDSQSPLARLSRELKGLLEAESEKNNKFHSDVRAVLESVKTRKEESARGTQHGTEFENLVAQVLMPEAQAAGDVCEAVRNSAGNIPRCKKGDFVLILSPESAAGGARIAIECKEEAGYCEADALKELEEARNNRAAQVGIFVYSKDSATPAFPMLRRVGSDILCVWDKNDPASDMVLRAATSLARALVVRERVASQQAMADFTEIDKAVSRIEKDAGKLAEVLGWAQNIERDSRKIIETIEPARKDLAKQVEQLREALADLKQERA